MATKKSKKDTSWMEDGDDAHFDGNPAVAKKSRRKKVASSTETKMKAKKMMGSKKIAVKK